MSEEEHSSERPFSRSGSRRALGRGLDALLPAALSTALREVDVHRIESNPNQPRQRTDRGALEDLAASLKIHGVVQPLVVAVSGDERYRLIVGERRWQAAKLAGLQKVPVIVKEASDKQTLELALIENIQRSDLNALEEAAAFQRLIDDFGMTQQQVADQIGKSRAAVANTLRLLVLPETLKRAVVEGRITEGHARVLLQLSDRNEQLAILEHVEREGWSVRQTEERVRRLVQAARPASKTVKSPDLMAVERSLRDALGTRVSLRPGRNGGRIIIEYGSNDEFEDLYRRLTGLG